MQVPQIIHENIIIILGNKITLKDNVKLLHTLYGEIPDFLLFWKLVLKIRKKNLKVIQIQLNRWRMQLGFERK